MPLEVADIADLIAATKPQRTEDRMTELSTDLQKCVAMGELMRNHKITHSGGDELEFFIMTTYTDSAENVGLYHVDTPTTGDVLTSGTIPWRATTANMSWDLQEPALNSSDEVRLLRFADLKRASMRTSLAMRYEKNTWGKPATSADVVTPYGFDMWATYPAAFTAAGFVGVNPAGFTSGAGSVNSTTYPRWSNYYAQYSAIEQNDLVDTMCDVFYETNFESPIPGGNPIPDYSGGIQHAIYSNWTVCKALRHLARAQNDDLGADLMPYHLSALFNGVPVTPVPFLDDSKDEYSDLAAYDPLYFIDWGVMKFEFLSGWDQRESTKEAPNQHLVVTTHVDSRYNLACRDRRRLGLITLDTLC